MVEAKTDDEEDVIEPHLKEISEKFRVKYNITIDPKVLKAYGSVCTEEQLYRLISNYQSHTLLNVYNKKILYRAVCEVLKNHEYWRNELSKMLLNSFHYMDLVENMQGLKDNEISDEVAQLFSEVTSESINYFDIKTYADLIHYRDRKNKICLDILSGVYDDDPENIPYYSIYRSNKEDLDRIYAFALLEYKFGISYYQATELLEKFATDLDSLPEGELKTYLQLIEEIVECEDIKDKVSYAIENDLLGEPWNGYPNALKAEKMLLNMYADLYNQTLYKPKIEDREGSVEYVDSNGNHYDIDVFRVKNDFQMDVRLEGALSEIDDNFKDEDGGIKDYNEFIDRLKKGIIENCGNSETYIRNDSISMLEEYDIAVGYERIYPNQLAAASTRVETDESAGLITNSQSRGLSLYAVSSVLRTPDNMIDNTRIDGTTRIDGVKKIIVNFNEVFKSRIIINDSGEIEQYKPSYVVWIENKQRIETQEDKEKRWNRTKRAAAQLGVPIVIVDRDYFANREVKKVELMKKLITGEEFDADENSEFISAYKGLSKPEIIKRLFITIENNRTGMLGYFNNYFKEGYCEGLRDTLFGAIDKMDNREKFQCLDAMIDVANKEKEYPEKVSEFRLEELEKYRKYIVGFYGSVKRLAEKRIEANVKAYYENSLTEPKRVSLLDKYLGLESGEEENR